MFEPGEDGNGRETEGTIGVDRVRTRTAHGRMLPRRTAEALAVRARIVLACADGATNQRGRDFAQRVTSQTASKWRARFVEHRRTACLTRLGQAHRAHRRCARRCCYRQDTGVGARGGCHSLEHAHHSSRDWRAQAAVSRIWRAIGLQLHRHETFKLSSDPPFAEKVRDIVGLYLAAAKGHDVVRGREEPNPGARRHATAAVAGPRHS